MSHLTAFVGRVGSGNFDPRATLVSADPIFQLYVLRPSTDKFHHTSVFYASRDIVCSSYCIPTQRVKLPLTFKYRKSKVSNSSNQCYTQLVRISYRDKPDEQKLTP